MNWIKNKKTTKLVGFMKAEGFEPSTVPIKKSGCSISLTNLF
ncbi:hypothetical protein FVB9288_01021 [Flavobacterium sp. CECT 9288]|nr:hypothetical protein FVB9288_01021 [Flavobacterium sp. CECT 9288]